ncbi:MAG: hypothetical protein QM483_00555 [Desulfuromusa sp.]
MKKQTTSIAIASIFAITSLFAAAATRISDQELGIGNYNEVTHTNSPRLDDRELGIGEYNEVTFNNSPRLDDRELGIGEYSDHA